MPVEIVQGERSSGVYYVYDDFVYCSTRKFRGIVYLKCREAGCNVTAVFCDGDDDMRVNGGHQHVPNPRELSRLKCRQFIREEASTTTLDYSQIHNEAVERYPDSSVVIEEARNIIRQTRNMNVPPVPSSLSDMYRLLSKPEWVRWTLAGQTRDEKFFTRQTVSADGLTSLHFFSPYLPPYVITVPQCDYYIGFLKVSNPSKKPIVVISVFVELGGRQRVIPLSYIFMEDYTEMAFIASLRTFLEGCIKASLMAPQRVFTDLSVCGLSAAVRAVWPGARLVQSLYSFTENVIGHCPDADELLLGKCVAVGLLVNQEPAITMLRQEAAAALVSAALNYLQSNAGESFISCSETPLYEIAAASAMTFDLKKALMTSRRTSVWHVIEAIRQYDLSLKKVLGGDPVRLRRGLRLDISVSFLQTVVTQSMNRIISLESFMAKAAHVLKTAVRHVGTIRRMMHQGSLLVQDGNIPAVEPPPRNALLEGHPAVVPVPGPVERALTDPHINAHVSSIRPAIHTDQGIVEDGNMPAVEPPPRNALLGETPALVPGPVHPAMADPQISAEVPLILPILQTDQVLVQDGKISAVEPPPRNALLDGHPAVVPVPGPVERALTDPNINAHVPSTHPALHTDQGIVEYGNMPALEVPPRNTHLGATTEVVRVPGPVEHALPDLGINAEAFVHRCLVCLVATANNLIEPCGHLGLCDDCASHRQALHLSPQVPDPEGGFLVRHNGCPVCKIPNITYRRIFF